MPSLTSNQIYLLKHVIDAAAEGRYCHGNGADWVITDESRTVVTHINHVTGDKTTMNAEDSSRYLANSRPYKCESTAKSLAEFISSN